MTKYLDFQPFGAAKQLFYERGDEVMVSGPAGTGKSRGCLERGHAIAEKYDNSRGLIVRKTRASMTNTTLVTYEQLVLPPGSADVTYRGATYRNGSTIDFGGLDKWSRLMSSEYDWIYVPEATELTEDDWEALTTRLRWGRVPYQTLFGDCNPGAPTHFLKRRANAGKLKMLESRHEDNPKLYNRKAQEWTPGGVKYISKLDGLTGHRYLRLRKGIWAAAEGLVYETFDPVKHMVDRFDIPHHWVRIWTIDFGYENPFVWQCWALDHDRRMYRVHEIYMTQRIVADHCQTIRDICKQFNEPLPAAIVCDHDAEGRATFEKEMGRPTVPAFKLVQPGIQAVQARLREAGDGRPRIMFLRDALWERDENLKELHKPQCTEEEFDSYTWRKKKSGDPLDEPVKINDHGMDDMRYAVAAVDQVWNDPTQQPQTVEFGSVAGYRISNV